MTQGQKSQQCENVNIWGTESGLWMETEVGFQSRALMWGQMPRVLGGGFASPAPKQG